MAGLVVDVSQILWHRLRVNHLARRLPAGSFASAAFAGLQDSAPRAALTSLHSRMEDVRTDAWEDPSLVQSWAPRGAVFVVPRSDLAVFALGILPRDTELRQALEQLAEKARESVQEPRVKVREEERLGPIAPLILDRMRRQPICRLAHALAGVQIRWDARSTQLIPGPALEMDEEAARRELARRTSAGRAGSGVLLAEDAERLARAEPVFAVSFVAFGGDPVLQPGEEIVAHDRSHRRTALPPWACSGLVLLDGAVVAAWGRRQRRVTILPLAPLGHGLRHRVEAEALRMPSLGNEPEVLWRERR